MSINRLNRQRIKYLINRRNYKIITIFKIDPYSDELYSTYKSINWKKGKDRKKRRLRFYQYRMYRTWKHNRRQQYKYPHTPLYQYE